MPTATRSATPARSPWSCDVSQAAEHACGCTFAGRGTPRGRQLLRSSADVCCIACCAARAMGLSCGEVTMASAVAWRRINRTHLARQLSAATPDVQHR